jgi:hypothetical protein
MMGKYNGENKIHFMKRIHFIILIIFICFSCSRFDKNDNKLSFEVIDASIYDGWTNVSSLKMFNTGKTYICVDKYNEPNLYFTVSVKGKELDSISKMADKIFKSHLDTLYKKGCEDCGYYNLIIKAENKNFKSYVDGRDFQNNNIKSMNELICYLENIISVSKNSIDSAFTFESKRLP